MSIQLKTIWKGWLNMKNILTKVLLALTLILGAVTLYNGKEIELKTAEISKLQQEQEAANLKITSLNKDIKDAVFRIKEADASFKRLSDKLEKLDNKKSVYPEKIKELKDANEETKNLLDTRLTNDLRRLLNEATGESND